MFLFNQDVFDEVISGTGTWYTSATFNALLGSADRLTVLAYPTGIGPGGAVLYAYLDGSADGQHWVTPVTTLWSGATLSEG